jgi:DNA-binding GntR family transcriptional regulator
LGKLPVKDDSKARKKRLFQSLRRDILTLQLAPGSDIDETSLAAAFGLSRTPLREVLQQLAGEGYVSLRENRGARVTEMSHNSLRDFFLVAPMIYAAVSRLAAQNAEPGQIVELKEAQSAFKNALKRGSISERALENNRFHAIIGAMAHNPYLLPSLNRLLIDHARISMTFYRPSDSAMAENVAKAVEHHDAFIEAIEARNEEAAAALAIEHWNLSRDQIETFVMPRSLDIQFGQMNTAKSA